MKKRIHWKRRSKNAIHGIKGYYVSITAVMKFKKPVCGRDADNLAIIDKALADLEKDYPQDIMVDTWFFSRSGRVLYVFLSVSRDFAKEHLKCGDYWAPEKYLGYYLSRVARRLRNSDRYFEKCFKDGMFTYKYIY